MDPVSFLPAIAALIAALATTYLITPKGESQAVKGHFVSIDGLRGYLAFAVFLHHACIWFFYLKTGAWQVPPSNLYTHFGQSGVALFFMITGFLFFSKVQGGKEKRLDWLKVFVSRVTRLVPLYMFSMFLLLVIVAYLSGGGLQDTLPQLAKNILKWLTFTVLGSPDINGVLHTSTIIAGVTWSLPYEWFFYFCLPLLALAIKVTPPKPYIAIAIASSVALAAWGPKVHHLLAFLGGIIACYCVRAEKFKSFAVGWLGSFIAIVCLVVTVAAFPSAYGFAPIALLATSFSLIAGGADLFGLLSNRISRTLGEMAYSIYLLHGILLFVAFNFVVGLGLAIEMTPFQHWLTIVCLSPILVLASHATCTLIEKPFMQKTGNLTEWLRSRLTGKAAAE